MPDIRIVPVEIASPETPIDVLVFDALVTQAGGLETGEDLATAVLIALLSDGLADPDELQFEHDGDRRGWWADHDADAVWGAPPIGSKLWLLRRAKASEETRVLAEQFCRDGLEPLADVGAISGFTVNLKRAGKTAITGPIEVFRDGLRPIAQRFDFLWDEVG